jgi:hypothetical protein
LPDPRADNALHDLTELLFIALMATLCGATSCVDMALFARMKAYLWRDVLVLKHGLADAKPGFPPASVTATLEASPNAVNARGENPIQRSAPSSR